MTKEEEVADDYGIDVGVFEVVRLADEAVGVIRDAELDAGWSASAEDVGIASTP